MLFPKILESSELPDQKILESSELPDQKILEFWEK